MRSTVLWPLALLAFGPTQSVAQTPVLPPSGHYAVVGTGLDLSSDGVHYTPAASFALPGPAGGMAVLSSGYLEISGTSPNRTWVFRYRITPTPGEESETRSLSGTVADRGGKIWPLTVTAPANFGGSPKLVSESGVYYLLLSGHVRIKLGNPT